MGIFDSLAGAAHGGLMAADPQYNVAMSNVANIQNQKKRRELDERRAALDEKRADLNEILTRIQMAGGLETPAGQAIAKAELSGHPAIQQLMSQGGNMFQPQQPQPPKGTSLTRSTIAGGKRTDVYEPEPPRKSAFEFASQLPKGSDAYYDFVRKGLLEVGEGPVGRQYVTPRQQTPKLEPYYNPVSKEMLYLASGQKPPPDYFPYSPILTQEKDDLVPTSKIHVKKINGEWRQGFIDKKGNFSDQGAATPKQIKAAGETTVNINGGKPAPGYNGKCIRCWDNNQGYTISLAGQRIR